MEAPLSDDPRPRTVRLVVEAVRSVVRAAPRGVAVAAGLQAVAAGAAFAVVLASQRTLQAVVDGADRADLLAPLVVLAVATALGSGVGVVQSHQQRLLGEDVAAMAWERLLGVSGRVDLEHLDSPEFVDRLERVAMNALDRPARLAAAVLGLAGSLFGVAALSVAVLRLEPLLVPLLLGAGLPSVLLARWASRSEFAFTRRWSELARRRHYLRGLLVDRGYAADVRACQTADEIVDRHRELSRRYRTVLRGQVRRRQVLVAATVTLNAGALVAALTVIAGLVGSGRLSLSQAGAAVIAVRLLSGQLDRFFGTIGSIVEAGPFLADLDDFVRTAVTRPPSDAPPWPLHDALELRDVRYRYPGGDREVLRGVDLVVRPGELVAVVGENGSGKTTLSKIAAGLYAPTTGEVRWDGVPVDDDRRGGLRRATSVIFQDFVRYDLTAAENIDLAGHRWGRTRADVETAARQARIDDVLGRLPSGLDTMLGRLFEGGHDLSGGQWQRVALARALVRRTPVVIFDEPSSGLDPRAEHDLMTDLRTRLHDRAALFISHRYANLHLADRIYVVADGRVVEEGTHVGLMAEESLYRRLYLLQSQAYQV